jgi:superfamily II DNA helicase RecQ
VIFYVGTSRDVIDFAQEISQLGRDGSDGQSIVLLQAEYEREMAELDTMALLLASAQVMETHLR